MKKVLFSMLACAAALSASADVTTFYCQGAAMCRYDGTADQLVMLPEGFTMRQASEVKQRGDVFVEKSAVSDRVEIFEEWIRDPANYNTVLNLVPCSHVLSGSFRWYWARALRITPAEGLTVTKVRIKMQNTTQYPTDVVEPSVDGEGKAVLKSVGNMVWTAADSTLTLTGNFDKPFYIQNMGENGEGKKGYQRPIFFEITTTGTAKQAATPQYVRNHPMLGEDQLVELTSSTEGAQIYYTIDYQRNWGSGQDAAMKPSTASTLYTGPFALEKDAIVRAIAVKEGMKNSFTMYQEINLMPAYTEVADFDFTDHTAIKDEEGNQIADFATFPVVDASKVGTATTEKVSIADNPAYVNDAYVTGLITNESNGQGCDITLSNSFGGTVQLRPLSGSKLFIGVPDTKYISALYIVGSQSELLALDPETPGTWKKGYVNGCDKIYTYDGKDVCEVVVDVTGSSQYLDRFVVFYSDLETDGVANVAVDANAPAEYFNLQGIRVAEPAKGNLYIKRQGTKTSKVIL